MLNRTGRNTRSSPKGDATLPARYWSCGMGTPTVRVTTPLARLWVTREGVCVGGRNALIRLVVPTWHARYMEMDAARPVIFGKGRNAKCIRFVVPSRTYSWAICRPRHVQPVLDEIERRGGKVERVPVRVMRMDPRLNRD